MFTVLFGAASAAFFGAADFIGGLAARRMTGMLVTAFAALAGVVALLLVAPLDGGVWYAETWIGGVATGVTSCLGIWLLYTAYAVGPMTTLAPVVAIVSTVVPMVAGLLTGETLGLLGWVAVVVGLVAIALVAAAPDPRATRARPVDVLRCALAGAFLGALYICLDSTPEDSGLTPLTANRITCAVVALGAATVMVMRRRRSPAAPDAAPAVVVEPRGGAVLAATRQVSARAVTALAVAMALGSGLLDATANALFTYGLSVGDLAVLSVVSGLYPAITILLALVLLGERPTRLQSVGIVLALVSMIGMSLA